MKQYIAFIQYSGRVGMSRANMQADVPLAKLASTIQSGPSETNEFPLQTTDPPLCNYLQL